MARPVHQFVSKTHPMGTYNTFVALSNTKVEADLRRLAKTRLQIFSTQEMNHPERVGIVNRLGARRCTP